MKRSNMYYLERKQQLNCSIDDAWEFFSNPRNLEQLTPKAIGFTITHLTAEYMHEGQVIGYKIRVAPFVWVSWVTEITLVREKVEFIDNQRVGPYKMWHHRHSFEENQKGVLMRDEVCYAMPFGILGKWMHSIYVRKQLRYIFDERSRLCEGVFTNKTK
mgnify:CR=1 FL=1